MSVQCGSRKRVETRNITGYNSGTDKCGGLEEFDWETTREEEQGKKTARTAVVCCFSFLCGCVLPCTVMKSAKFQMSSPITYCFRFWSKTSWYFLSTTFWYSSENITGGSWPGQRHSLLHVLHTCHTEMRQTVDWLSGQRVADISWFVLLF